MIRKSKIKKDNISNINIGDQISQLVDSRINIDQFKINLKINVKLDRNLIEKYFYGNHYYFYQITYQFDKNIKLSKHDLGYGITEGLIYLKNEVNLYDEIRSIDDIIYIIKKKNEDDFNFRFKEFTIKSFILLDNF